MKDFLEYDFSEISTFLDRDSNTIWTTYNKAMDKKIVSVYNFDNEKYFIPIKIFSNRIFSVLESVCVYLKNKGLKNRDIARLINKNDRTIWTVLNRAKRKGGLI